MRLDPLHTKTTVFDVGSCASFQLTSDLSSALFTPSGLWHTLNSAWSTVTGHFRCWPSYQHPRHCCDLKVESESACLLLHCFNQTLRCVIAGISCCCAVLTMHYSYCNCSSSHHLTAKNPISLIYIHEATNIHVAAAAGYRTLLLYCWCCVAVSCQKVKSVREKNVSVMFSSLRTATRVTLASIHWLLTRALRLLAVRLHSATLHTLHDYNVKPCLVHFLSFVPLYTQCLHAYRLKNNPPFISLTHTSRTFMCTNAYRIDTNWIAHTQKSG